MLPDFLVVIAYGLILPQEVLNIPRIASVNIHASLLPKYRGPAPIQFSLINGDSETGITAMQMNSKMDTGDILAQETVKIKPDDCFKTLHDRLSEKSPTLLVSTLKKMAQGVISPRPQIHAEATYTTKITSTLAQINWKQNASKLVYLIRAMYPSPGAWFDFDGDRIKVGAAIEGSATTAIPGSRLACDPKQGIQIACGENSSIFLLLLQRPGKAMMPASEFLKGYSKLISSENFAS